MIIPKTAESTQLLDTKELIGFLAKIRQSFEYSANQKNVQGIHGWAEKAITLISCQSETVMISKKDFP